MFSAIDKTTASVTYVIYVHNDQVSCFIALVKHFTLYTLCLEKTVHFYFWKTFVKFPPTLISFGRQMAK